MNRQKYILDLVKGKKVLDVGCIDHEMERANNDQWLHKHIAQNADYTLGIDISKDEVKKAQNLGYNFIYGDAEHLESYVQEKFDICVAGELIEHLANPGLFLHSVRSVLKENGKLVLTTPNAFALGNIFRILKHAFKRNVPTDNEEHKAWYDMCTLEQLLESQGFEVVEIYTNRPDRESSFLNSLKYRLYGNANFKIFCLAQVAD